MAHLGLLEGGTADLESRHGGLQQLHEPIEHAPLHQDAAARAAVLPRVVEDGSRRGRGRPLEVRVGEHDVGALAAELQRHGLDLGRAAGGHAHPDGGGAGEDPPPPPTLAHPLVRDEALPDDIPATRITWNRCSGSPDSSASSARRSAVSGVHSAGLRSTALPAASAGAKPQAAIVHREVPGHDDADHAQRLVEGDVDAAGHRDLRPQHPLRGSGVVVEHVADVSGLPARRSDRMPGVAHLDTRQLLDGAVHGRREPAQTACPVGGCEPGPQPLRDQRPLDRLVDLLDRREPDLLDERLVGRIDQLDRAGHADAIR